jgi:ABC-type oligopeptide transport system substrate-binding subunit
MNIKITALAAAALLLAAPLAMAESNNVNSASKYAPGQKQKSPGGATEFAPGQRQTYPGQASQFAPGHLKNNPNNHMTTGTGGRTR